MSPNEHGVISDYDVETVRVGGCFASIHIGEYEGKFYEGCEIRLKNPGMSRPVSVLCTAYNTREECVNAAINHINQWLVRNIEFEKAAVLLGRIEKKFNQGVFF